MGTRWKTIGGRAAFRGGTPAVKMGQERVMPRRRGKKETEQMCAGRRFEYGKSKGGDLVSPLRY